MSIVMEGEIINVNVRLKQVMRVIFQNIVRRSFKFPEAWVATYFKTGPSFAGLMWLVVAVN